MYGNVAFWNRVDDEQLSALWLKGYSTREIGKMLKRSRNSVIGRAHRLNLPKHAYVTKAQFTDDQVKDIRTKAKRLPLKAIAAQYGVKYIAIWRLLKRQTYAGIE